MAGLWNMLTGIPEVKVEPKKIINKINNPKQVTQRTVSKKSAGVSIDTRLAEIKSAVYAILGRYKDNTLVIKTREQLKDYVDTAIKNNLISIDTETNNSLDPVTCKLMGGCIYTPGMLNAYIPVNHVNPYTRERLDWQLTEQDIKEEFDRFNKANTFVVTHNGKFDYEVLLCTTGYKMNIAWDTMVGARILNENERSAGLKQQYIDKIDPTVEKYSIDHLFEGIEYALVDPELFALYAATDSFMTYKLYDYQKKEFDRPDQSRLKNVFLNVEMPVVEVAAAMELAGVCIDKEYASRLSAKYHKQLDNVDNEIAEELKKYSDKIAAWRVTPEAMHREMSKKPNKNGEYTFQKSLSEKLADPPQLTSPTQLAILLYDVLKCKVVDKDKPRGTGEEILEKLDLPLCTLVLKKRGLEKLIGTYIDKLPECVSSKDGRLHAHFNQLGAGTGRFSSSDPNLQNIPSHNQEIRLMFKASDGCVFVGSDFSLLQVG